MVRQRKEVSCQRALRWTANGTPKDLLPPESGTEEPAHGVGRKEGQENRCCIEERNQGQITEQD